MQRMKSSLHVDVELFHSHCGTISHWFVHCRLSEVDKLDGTGVGCRPTEVDDYERTCRRQKVRQLPVDATMTFPGSKSCPCGRKCCP